MKKKHDQSSHRCLYRSLRKAPEKVLATLREKLADYKAQLDKSKEALEEI